ncbi:hypothetical protein KBC54_01920, partial [Patescibacteria group bacterium]|nr:hypothetical protein [Patescibacteria group bacterium]
MPEQRKPSDTGIEDAHVETHTKSTVETIALELETLGQENAQLFEDVQALQKRIDELLNDAETMKTLASVDPALKARLGRASGAVLRIFPEIAAQRSESKKIRDQEKQFQQYSLKAETVIGNEKAAKLTELFSTKDPTLQERIINGLKSALNEKNSAGQKAKLEGLLFEVSRLDILHSQGLEQVYVGQPPAMDITYEARNGKRVTKAPVLPDAFIQREDGLYAYEAKFLPRMPYGSTDGHHDQIAKYQAAIEQKKITGATVELRGRIDPNFLKYVCGSGIEDPGPVPDVEIIYTLPLPSGAEYRFPLKRIQTMNGLKFANEDKRYTPEDHHIIAGVQRALQDRTIIEIISSPQVSTPELQPFLADPMKIPTSELYDTFQQEVLANVHQRLLDKRSVINHDNRQNARNPEFATVEMTQTIVLDALKTFQLFLRDNPHMAKAKAAYIVKPENWQAVTELATKHIQTVRKHEEVRQASADEQLRQAERKQLGYYARPEGIALDLDHFLLDAIQEVNAEVEN